MSGARAPAAKPMKLILWNYIHERRSPKTWLLFIASLVTPAAAFMLYPFLTIYLTHTLGAGGGSAVHSVSVQCHAVVCGRVGVGPIRTGAGVHAGGCHHGRRALADGVSTQPGRAGAAPGGGGHFRRYGQRPRSWARELGVPAAPAGRGLTTWTGSTSRARRLVAWRRGRFGRPRRPRTFRRRGTGGAGCAVHPSLPAAASAMLYQ